MTAAAMELRDDRRTNWLWIDNEVITEHGAQIGATGIALYCALVMYTGKARTCFPSKKTLAENIAVTVPTVDKYLAKLVSVGLLAIEHRYDESGRQTSNLYILLPVPKTAGGWGQKFIPPEGHTNEGTNHTHLEPDISPAPVVAGTPPESQPKRKPSQKTIDQNAVSEAFCEEAKIERLPCSSKADFRRDGAAYMSPAKRIIATCGGDVDEARKLVRLAVQRLQGDGLTISSLRSVEKTVTSLKANGGRRNGNGRTPDAAEHTAEDYMAAMRETIAGKRVLAQLAEGGT